MRMGLQRGSVPLTGAWVGIAHGCSHSQQASHSQHMAAGTVHDSLCLPALAATLLPYSSIVLTAAVQPSRRPSLHWSFLPLCE